MEELMIEKSTYELGIQVGEPKRDELRMVFDWHKYLMIRTSLSIPLYAQAGGPAWVARWDKNLVGFAVTAAPSYRESMPSALSFLYAARAMRTLPLGGREPTLLFHADEAFARTGLPGLLLGMYEHSLREHGVRQYTAVAHMTDDNSHTISLPVEGFSVQAVKRVGSLETLLLRKQL
jgi:hypothetical protein